MKLLIIPWFNANSRNISKYVKKYIELGIKKDNIDIFNYNFIDSLTFSGLYKIHKNNLNNKKNYDIVHNFSGGSLIQYQLKKSNWNFEKIIIDSGPMFPTVHCTNNYIINSNILPKSFSNFSKFGINTIWNLNDFDSNVKEHRKLMELNYNEIIFPSDKEKLLFNSNKDKIILLDYILKMNDDKTKSILYDNSPHVQHMKYNNEHYTETLFNFINK
jgi:hypothetical protein